jgi:hypothetical protein
MAKQRGLGTFSLSNILTPQEHSESVNQAESHASSLAESPAPVTQETPERQVTPPTQESLSTPVSNQERGESASRERRTADAASTVRDTVYMPAPLERRLANAVYWARMTKNAIFLEGVERVLTDLETANGGPFPDIPPQTILKHARAGRRRH